MNVFSRGARLINMIHIQCLDSRFRCASRAVMERRFL